MTIKRNCCNANLLYNNFIGEKMRNIVGPPVSGEDFWDREEVIELIGNSLKKQSVLLSAPRRFGKTSIMRKIYENSMDYLPIFIDVEGLERPEEFISILISEVYKRNKNLKDNFLKNIGIKILERIDKIDIWKLRISLKENLKENWFELGRELFKTLKISEKPILFLIDEIPLMIRNIKDKEIAKSFLHWLRGLRQMPEISEKTRWVFGSSIGFNYVIKNVGTTSEVINDLKTIRIAEFERSQAEDFIKKLIDEEIEIKDLDSSIIDGLLHKVGTPIPFFLQVIINELINLVKGGRFLSPDLIKDAYDQMLSPWNRSYFEHYYERLAIYYEPQMARVVKKMLSLIAKKDTVNETELLELFRREIEGKEDEDTFSLILSDLENDFYVVKRDTYYQFSTKLLKDWWNRYYG